MIALHLPTGIPGWTVFAIGILLVAVRVRGVDAPRAWVEWVERQFTYGMNLRFIGAALIIAALALRHLQPSAEGTIGLLYATSLLLLGVLGVGLLLLQNHMRHLVIATAEVSDRTIRLVSIFTTIVGAGFLLAPFFL